jgi:hypothetical protein
MRKIDHDRSTVCPTLEKTKIGDQHMNVGEVEGCAANENAGRVRNGNQVAGHSDPRVKARLDSG